MNILSVLAIPHYNRQDLTARCIASIDFPVDNLVIVDQGATSCFELSHDAANGFRSNAVVEALYSKQCDEKKIGEVHRIRHPNAGVAGAWNEIIKLFPAPWWLIANNDIEFAPGDLEKMSAFINYNRDVGMAYGNHGASWFGITAEAVARAGLFDENIFPAYLEDCDMSQRFDLLGLRRCDVPDVHAKHGDDQFSGSCTIMSDVEARAKNAMTHGRNFDYYRAKWGGINEQETFKTPFNDPNWPVWAWRFDPAFRAGNQW